MAILVWAPLPGHGDPAALRAHYQRLESRRLLASLLVVTLSVLGAVANRLAETEPAGSDATVRFILEREDACLASGRIGTFLEALGNAGSPAGFPAIARYLDAADDGLRADSSMSGDRSCSAACIRQARPNASRSTRKTSRRRSVSSPTPAA